MLGLGDDDSSDDEVAEYKERLKQLRRHGVKEGFHSDSDSEDKDAKEDDGQLMHRLFYCVNSRPEGMAEGVERPSPILGDRTDSDLVVKSNQ